MKRQIPTKNYFMLLGLTIVTFMVVLYFGSWYKTTNEYKNDISPLISVLNSITIEELDSYLLDNPESIIYISGTEKNYEYEKELKKIIENNNLQQTIIYLNLKENDYDKMDKYYFNDKLKINNLVIFENNKIQYFVAHNEKDLTKDNTINFLKEHEVIEE